MSDQIQLQEKSEISKNSTLEVVGNVESPAACPVQKKSWLKGWLPMAICCGTPLLLVAAISVFGVSLGTIASGALSLAAVLACPLGMWIMMRMMMKQK